MAFRITQGFFILLLSTFFCCKKAKENTAVVIPTIPDTSIRTGVYNWTGTIFEINYYNPNNTINGATVDQFSITAINDSTISIGDGSSIKVDFAILHFIRKNDTAKTKEYFNSIYGYRINLLYNYDTKKMNYKEVKEDTSLGVERRLILETI